MRNMVFSVIALAVAVTALFGGGALAESTTSTPAKLEALEFQVVGLQAENIAQAAALNAAAVERDALDLELDDLQSQLATATLDLAALDVAVGAFADRDLLIEERLQLFGNIITQWGEEVLPVFTQALMDTDVVLSDLQTVLDGLDSRVTALEGP